MTIGAISFQPYVYNVNAIGPASMNKLSKISDNVLDKKTDFSGLVENENPLKKGQTLNFQDMLEMQMQRGRSNAARVMKPSDAPQEAEQAQSAAVPFRTKNAVDAAGAQFGENTASENTQYVQSAALDGSDAGNAGGNYRMQQAIDAYQMFMTA